MTVRLALVPPGLTAGAREGLVGADEPLDEHGRAAALAVAERRVLPTGVPSWVAPSTQCRETAGLLGLQPVDDEGLRDWDLGRWVGRSMTDVAQQEGADVAAWRADPSSAVHGGESLLQLIDRAGAWLARVPTLGRRAVVAVAPLPVVRALLVHALGVGPEPFWRLDVEPLAVVRMTVSDDRVAVRWRSATE
ncbi:histidine phosphatase family protein [Angustibacter aerolatus]